MTTRNQDSDGANDKLALPVTLLPFAHHELLSPLCMAISTLSDVNNVRRHFYHWRLLLGAVFRRDPCMLLASAPEDLITSQNLTYLLSDLVGRNRGVDYVREKFAGVCAATRGLFPGREFPEIEEARKAIAVMNPIDDSNLGDGWRRIAILGDLPTAHAARVMRLDQAVKTRSLDPATPLSKTSKGNAEEEYRRFLGALMQAGIAWCDVAPEALVTPQNILIACRAFHNAAEPWRDADRLKALKFALKHLFSDVDLGFVGTLIATLRARHPAPKRSLPGVRKKGPGRKRGAAIKGERLEDLILLEQEFKKDDLDRDEADPFEQVRLGHQQNLRRAVEGFLGVLKEKAPDLYAQPVGERDYKLAVGHYVDDLRLTCSARTIVTRLQELASAYHRILLPRRMTFLKKEIATLRREAPKPAVAAPELTSKELEATGRALMDRAWRMLTDLKRCSYAYQSRRKLAELYRNGLIIFMLSALPLRLRTLSSLLCHINLVQEGAHYVLDIPPELTKTGEPEYQDLDSSMTEPIDRYLTTIRSMIINDEIDEFCCADERQYSCEDAHPTRIEKITPKSNALWSSRDDAALTPSAFQRIVPKIIFEHHGIAISCHEFRHIRASDEIDHDMPRRGAAFLGHRSDRVTGECYEDSAKRDRLANERSALDERGERDLPAVPDFPCLRT